MSSNVGEAKKAKPRKSIGFKIGLLLTAASVLTPAALHKNFEALPKDKNKTELFKENAQQISEVSGNSRALPSNAVFDANNININGWPKGLTESIPDSSKNIQFLGDSIQAMAMGAMIEVLKTSEYGQDVVKNADTTGLSLGYDMFCGGYGYFSPDYNFIGINPLFNTGAQLVTLAHEMTHAKQTVTGSSNFEGLTPLDFIILYRSMEADACAGEVEAAWQLKQKGLSSAWDSMIDSDYGDIYKAYEKEVTKDSNAVVNGSARRAAFDQWFGESWRRDSYDEHALKYGLMLAHNFQECIFQFSGKTKIQDKFKIMGCINDSTNYLVTGTARDTLNAEWYKGNMTLKNKALMDSLQKAVNIAFLTKNIIDHKWIVLKENSPKSSEKMIETAFNNASGNRRTSNKKTARGQFIANIRRGNGKKR